ncbi:hypothetical protein M422DRAFT_79410, partial [Sphaerobolus stellatus SS14]
DDPLPFTQPNQRYHIFSSPDNPIYINTLLCDHTGDPAIKDFYNNLRDHILARLHHLKSNDDELKFSVEEHQSVIIKDERIYMHTTCRFNFTTYDMR